MNFLKLSKKVSYILRHNPFKFGLKLDEDGFVPVKDLCKKINLKEKDIYELVEKQTRRRFEIKGNKIRALYGHTVIKIKYKETELPELLFHGTSKKNAEKILKEGLKPMKRHYVHLSINKKDAFFVGKRHDQNPVILKIKAKRASEEGISFYKAGDLYLADYIPQEFIEK